MVARPKSRVRPIDAAAAQLMALAAKGVPPIRMAREVEVIASQWLKAGIGVRRDHPWFVQVRPENVF